MEDIMTVDLMIMKETTEVIIAVIIEGEVKGMEEEILIIDEKDIQKMTVNLVMEVGRKVMEEEDIEGAEAVVDQMTEGLEVKGDIVDFKRVLPWNLAVVQT